MNLSSYGNVIPPTDPPEKAAIERVIEGGYCVGCGACAFVAPNHFSVGLEDDGCIRATAYQPDADTASSLDRICPMTGVGSDETDIGTRTFPDAAHYMSVGSVLTAYIGSASEGDLRQDGGSGGIATWVLLELMRSGKVDGVLHVVPGHPVKGEPLFRYGISVTEEQVRGGSKARYYPVEMSQVLSLIAKSSGRYAVVGLPCFLKAVRRLVAEGALSQDRVPFLIGLVCGHLKSRYFADYLSWQAGRTDGELGTFDFRVKIPGRKASDYGFKATWASAEGALCEASRPMSEVRGKDWGEGLFKYTACEFCDDVFAECADITLGDAWLDGWVEDSSGTNIVVARNVEMADLLLEGHSTGRLSLKSASVDELSLSQASGLRHRREGLAHRLQRRLERGVWFPQKRVAPHPAPSRRRRKVYDLREKIAVVSNKAFMRARESGDIKNFERELLPILEQYRSSVAPHPIRLFVRRLRSFFNHSK